jgi:hypothetical protein
VTCVCLFARVGSRRYVSMREGASTPQSRMEFELAEQQRAELVCRMHDRDRAGGFGR